MFTKKTIAASLVAFLLGVALGLILVQGRNEPSEAAALERPELILYSLPNFEGRELHIFEDAVDLPFEDLADGSQMLWNDNVGSIVVVSGTWRLYQHGRMNSALDDTPREFLDVRSKAPVGGWSSVLSGTSRGPLKIASPELGGIGSDISSIELISAQNLPDWSYRGK